MVDIPTNVQQLLVCSKCDKLLQRGPVYQQHDGEAVCGPCQTAAQLLWFPCRYHEYGCQTTVPFVAAGSTEFNYEDACEYRQYKCPVLGYNPCEWKGRRNELQQHCQEEHPDCVLTNPAVITPDIHQSQMTNYIIPAFGLLFLLHSRVCKSTAKLQYAVRLLAAPQLALNYSFVVAIQRGEIIYKKIWDVLPQELLVLEEHSALNLNTSDLLSMLNGWEGASLSVGVKGRETRAKPDEERGTHELQIGLEQKRAPKRRLVTQREKPVAVCPPRNIMCRNEGCNFQDIGEKKRDKHSNWFCTRRIKCFVCNKSVQKVNTQWQNHYTTCKLFEVIPADSSFLVVRIHCWQRFLVETAAGLVVCRGKYTEKKIILRVCTPVPCDQLYLYRCEVQLQSAGRTWTYTPETLYDDQRDWEVVCNIDALDKEVYVRLQVKKN